MFNLKDKKIVKYYLPVSHLWLQHKLDNLSSALFQLEKKKVVIKTTLLGFKNQMKF